MTNTTTRRRCTDCHIQLNSSNTNSSDTECDRCYDLAGLEASHQDGAHEDEADADCLMCDPNARADRSRPSNDVKAHTSRSHADCYDNDLHPMTKEGRADCRKGKFHNA